MWKCSACNNRNEGQSRTCGSCKSRRGTGRRTFGKRIGTEWAAKIRASYNGRCRRCGHFHKGIQAAHIIRRARSHNTRWHPRGGIPLCDRLACGCHYWLDEEASDLERAAFVISVVGQETYDELHTIKNQPWDKDLGAAYAKVKEMQ